MSLRIPLAEQSYVLDEGLIMQEHHTVYNGFLIAMEPDLYGRILRPQKKVPWMLRITFFLPPVVLCFQPPLVWVNQTTVLVVSEDYCYCEFL